MIGKSELAMRYFPECSSPKVANDRLQRWIASCPALDKELTALHHRKAAKVFTPREVALIVEYLGEA